MEIWHYLQGIRVRLLQHLGSGLVGDTLNVFMGELVIIARSTQPVVWSEYVLGELEWLFLLTSVISFSGANSLLLCSLGW